MTRSRVALSSMLAALGLSACVVAPYYPYGSSGASSAGELMVDSAPPAPQAEVIPVMPFAGAVWIGGYWGWRTGRYYWVPGYWSHPRPGYTWRPHRWEPIGGRWAFRGGGWAPH